MASDQLEQRCCSKLYVKFICAISLYISLFRIQPIECFYRLLVPELREVSYSRCGLPGLTHIVKTIPPLSINRANLGTAPDQNVRIPSSLKILAAQTKLFLYSFRACIDCILQPISRAHLTGFSLKRPHRVLMVSKGCVTYL